ncbi:Ig-like domain-containing protein [Brevibacterium metallidurans]|uniref:LPXTG-motif cell wall anchor domain-containing protein n=1 Tax=Brevibacterium metallidurans TaxID=1482676 RepID=A0ABN0SIW2_9MICO
MPSPITLHRRAARGGSQPRSRTMSGFLAGAAALVLAVGFLAPTATPAQAAEVDAVTTISTTPDPGSVRARTQLPVKIDFAVPESATAGDTVTVNLASQIDGAPSSIELKDDSGAVIANCEVATRTVTCTFTDYVDSHSDVEATLDFPSIARIPTQGAGLDFTTGSGTKFHTRTEITPLSGGLPTKMYKLYDSNPDGSITYRVGIGAQQLQRNGLRIEDFYDARTVLDKDSVSATRRSRDIDGGMTPTVYLTRGEDFTVSFDDATPSFRVDFDSEKTESTRDYAYWIFYTVYPDDSVKDGDVLRNTAVSGSEKATQNVTYKRPAGGGSGSIGYLSWQKVDENGDLLPGAEFSLTGPNGYEKTIVDNGELDGDKTDGRFRVGKLVKGEYTLTEVKAPAGYETSDEAKTVTLSSGGGMSQDAGKIVNVKSTTSEADASTDGTEADASADGSESDASTDGSEADASTDGSEADASTDGADSDAAADTGDAASGADGSDAGASADGTESDSASNADSAANSVDSDAASNSDDGSTSGGSDAASAANGSNGTSSSGGASNGSSSGTGSNGGTSGTTDSGSTSGSNGGSLPRTGVETLGMVGIAAGLMALGVAVVFLARRRAERTD